MLKFVLYFFLIALIPIWVFVIGIIMIKIIMIWRLLFLCPYLFFRYRKKRKVPDRIIFYSLGKIIKKYSFNEED